jgi:hypothetical protein
MNHNTTTEPGLEYTTPENRGTCAFCGKEEEGYAKRDSDGKMKPACWKCVKPATSGAPQPKRRPVGTTYTDESEEDDMARTDGRIKCGTRGCHNYVKPPQTICGKCAKAFNTLAGERPAESPVQEESPASVIVVDGPGATLAVAASIKDIAAPVLQATAKEEPPIPVMPTTEEVSGLKPRSATAEAKRNAEIAAPAYVELFQKALAARTKKVCANGHDLTQIQNAHVGDLKRTGKIACDICNRMAQAKLGSK